MRTPEVGEPVDAVVERVEPYGAWLRAGDHVGLVTLPELSWQPVRSPSEVCRPGDHLRVLVLGVSETGFRASVRALHPESDPWTQVARLSPGATFEGRLTRHLSYGWLVEVAPGVVGRLANEECPAGLGPGDRLRVRIESVDHGGRRIELRCEGGKGRDGDHAITMEE